MCVVAAPLCVESNIELTLLQLQGDGVWTCHRLIPAKETEKAVLLLWKDVWSLASLLQR